MRRALFLVALSAAAVLVARKLPGDGLMGLFWVVLIVAAGSVAAGAAWLATRPKFYPLPDVEPEPVAELTAVPS